MFLLFTYCFLLFNNNHFLRNTKVSMDPREYYKPPTTRVNINNSSSVSINSYVFINKNIENVWNKLIDYESLTNIVPYLEKSKIITQSNNGTILYQESSKNILFIPYTNRMMLYVKENNTLSSDRTVTFSLIKSNLFSNFNGKWIVKYHTENYTWLDYSLNVSINVPVPLFIIKNKMFNVVEKTIKNVIFFTNTD